MRTAVSPAPARPLTLPITFAGLRPGSYPVHLHSKCSGSQTFHLAYLPTLHVGALSAGTILIPRADFGIGWCLIVYTNTSRPTVLTVRRI